MTAGRAASGDARPKILILSYTSTVREPRALKQIALFRDRYDVTTAGFGPRSVEGVRHLELESSPPRRGVQRLPGLFSFLLLIRAHALYERLDPLLSAASRRLSTEPWDVVIAHDVRTVALAEALAPRRGVLVDLHEYAPGDTEPTLAWRLLQRPFYRWICRRRVARAAQVTTVSSGIADRYRREFGFDPAVVVNATPYQSLVPRPVGTTIRLVHSGVPAPERRLEMLIDAVRATTSPVTLDLFLVGGSPDYERELVARAGDDPRITFREPVPYDALVRTLNGYDVGLSVFPPVTFNLAWCLPNKFFDFIQARLGVVVGPSPAMVDVVRDRGIGVVTQDFTTAALITALDGLTPGMVRAWKDASHAASDDLSAERQSSGWAVAVESILAAP